MILGQEATSGEETVTSFNHYILIIVSQERRSGEYRIETTRENVCHDAGTESKGECTV